MRHFSILSAALLVLGTVLGAVAKPVLAAHAQRRSENPPETVTAILQDRAGFLWIGSREGLSLYDGYSFRIFEHDVSDPASISANLIRTVFEDSRGRLWTGTNTGGLNALNRTDWTFTHYRHDSADPHSLSHDSVYTIEEDDDGFLWVGTQIGLNRLDPATGVFTRYPAAPDDPHAPSHDYINTIHKDRHGILWIGTVGGGLNRLDPSTGVFRSYHSDPADPATLSGESVFAIAERPDGALWLGTGNGIDLFRPDTETVQRYPYHPLGQDGTDQDLVTSLALGPDGRLYFGTWGNGLKMLAPDHDRSGDGRNPTVRRIPSADRIVCLTTGARGSIWVGAWGNGLDRIRPDAGIFKNISTQDTGSTPEPAEVTSILEDRQGRLWIGEYQGPLLRRDSEAGVFRPYPGSTGSRLTLMEDGTGSIWSGFPSSLERLDPESGETTRYAHDPSDPDSLGAGWIWSILEDRRGRLWVGTGEAGLNRMREDGGFDKYLNDPDDPASMSDNYIIALHERSDGDLWVGTRSGGLNLFDPVHGTARRFLPVPGDPFSLSHHYVSSLLESRNGTLWVGTGGGGINRLKEAPDGKISFVRYTEKEGLVNNTVMGMVEDDDGSLWISTQNGLSRFNPADGRFINYDLGDGLPSLEFDLGAAAGGKARIYFGTTRGAISIPRGTPFPAPGASPVVLTSIRTPNNAVLGEKPPWELKKLRVPYGEILSFEFAVLDFEDRYRHRYSYRLQGLRDQWIDLESRREITFTNLNPGEFSLQVRGRNAQGIWGETSKPLELVVVPPFWMTPWFRLLMFLALSGIVVGIHRWRTADLNERHRRLQIVKDQREQALEKVRANQELLHKAYDRLRRLTQRLEAAKEDERKRIARELHDEMGQALTTAKINLELMHDLEDPGEHAQKIDDTISLLDGMISHVRALSLDLRPPLLDELGLIPAIRNYLEIQSHRSGLKIEADISPVPSGLSPEIEILVFRVIQEALTNVLRHAEASSIHVGLSREPGRLRIRIRDDGRGFDVEEALERGAKGHHLGLLGIQERVEATGGQVRLRSAPGHGAEIDVDVPLSPVGEDDANPAGG